MKHFLNIAAICCCMGMAQSGFAQFTKGSLWAGGSIGFSNNYYNNVGYNPQNTTNRSSFGVYPNLSYAIKDNWLASFETGIYTGETTLKEEFASTQGLQTTISSDYRVPINLSISHYWDLGKKFHLGLGLRTGAGIKGGKSKQDGSQNAYIVETVTTGLDWEIGLLPSLNYGLGERVLLTMSAGSWYYYQSLQKTVTNRISTTNPNYNSSTTLNNNYGGFSGNFSLNNIQIGAYYIIQPKTKKTE